MGPSCEWYTTSQTDMLRSTYHVGVTNVEVFYFQLACQVLFRQGFSSCPPDQDLGELTEKSNQKAI